MRKLSYNEVDMVGGGVSAQNLTGMGVSAIQLGTGLITGNVLRVTTASFMFGYNLGGALGLGAFGAGLGGRFYILMH